MVTGRATHHAISATCRLRDPQTDIAKLSGKRSAPAALLRVVLRLPLFLKPSIIKFAFPSCTRTHSPYPLPRRSLTDSSPYLADSLAAVLHPLRCAPHAARGRVPRPSPRSRIGRHGSKKDVAWASTGHSWCHRRTDPSKANLDRGRYHGSASP